MSTSFIFRPHVIETDSVVTPDILIDDVYVADSRGDNLKISRITIDRLTSNPEIQVLGRDTTADAAIFLVGAGAGMLIGLASNHCHLNQGDPQMFSKPVCRQIWRFDDVVSHWQELVIRAAGPKDDVLQEGLVGNIAPVKEIVSEVSTGQSTLLSGTAIMCVGLAFEGKVALATSYCLTLSNPNTGRQLELLYNVREL